MDHIVSSGIVSSGIILDNFNRMTVLEDGTAECTTVDPGGVLTISSGGTANNTTVNSNGQLYLSSGGTAVETIVSSGGRIDVLSGGVANNTAVSNENGEPYPIPEFHAIGLHLSNGAVANDTVVSGMYTFLFVSSGATANGVIVNKDGSANVSSGAVIYNATVNRGGWFNVYEDGTANDIVINGMVSGVTVHSGGTACNVLVNKYGRLTVSRGGTATVAFNPWQGNIDANEEASMTYLERDAKVYYGGEDVGLTSRGDILESLEIESGNSAIVYSGGIVNGATVNSGGLLDVSSGGSVNTAEVCSGGKLTVSGGAETTGITVLSGGEFFVGSDANIVSATIQSGGRITGAFDCSGITFESGAVLDIDISGLLPGSTDVPVRGLSVSQGIPDYTLTISENQSPGKYRIAENASGFDRTISVIRSGMETGQLTPGQAVEIGNAVYKLELDNSDLTLSIEPTQYIYLDFDGANSIRYRNSDLNLSFNLSVRNSGISEKRQLAILAELSEQYAKDGIAFTRERPVGTAYSTLYIGQTDAFKGYGDFFGIAEAHDRNNTNKGDCAFILLDQSYSDGQIVSVSSHMVDHLMGYSYLSDENPEVTDFAEKKYLLSTEWGQRDPYNKYCPTDPKTKKRCLTGCTNTAAAQIINYWIEKGLLDFSLTLDESDAYTKNGITIDNSSNPRAGYLSFSEINKLLADYKTDDNDSIAALCFAVGVIQKGEYGSDSTSTSWNKKLFYRSGFENNINYTHYSKDFWPGNSESYQGEKNQMLDDDFVIRELLQGRPVGIAMVYSAGIKEDDARHAVVLDGYDSSENKFHLNYGWSGTDNRWYTLKELNDRCLDQFFTGIVPDVSPNLEVKNLSFDLLAVNRNETVSLQFDLSNTGKEKSVATQVFVCSDEDTVLSTISTPFISPCASRGLSASFSTDSWTPGEHTITVKVRSQNDENDYFIASQTLKVYDGAITAEDDTWKRAASGGSRTKFTAEYDEEGLVAETVIADWEYVGVRDLVDYRELTLDHAGQYTFTLSDADSDLTFSIYSLTAKNELKLEKSRSILAPETGITLSDVPLHKGTYYIAVRAANEETPGNSDYRLVFSGSGFTKAGNTDDWTDMKTKGGEGKVLSVGLIEAETTDLVIDEWVGLGDHIDYREFRIPEPAMVSFTVTATDAVKFSIHELTEKTDKKGVVTYSLKTLQSTSVKPGEPVTTKGLLLPEGNVGGKYYFSVESTSAAKGGNADYSVSFNPDGSVFFTRGNNADDWTDMKTAGASGAVGDAGALNGKDLFEIRDWAGFGDACDYTRVTLDSAAKLSFLINASDEAKFSIFRLNRKTDKQNVTTYSLKSLQSAKLAFDKNTGDYSVKTKLLMLDAGEYYLAFESTNAAKGGNADYTMTLSPDSAFFTNGNNADDWTDMKTLGDASGNYAVFGPIDAETDTVTENGWVGFGDVIDYTRIHLDSAAKLSFSLDATEAVKFSVFRLNAKTDKQGVTTYSLKSLQSTTLKKNKLSGEFAATTKPLLLDAGDYYIAMESTGAKKGGNAFYDVQLDPGSVFYTEADNSDDWTDMKTLGDASEMFGSAGVIDAANENLLTDWVGFGDPVDYRQFTLETDAKLSFELFAEDAAKFTVWKLNDKTDKKGSTTHSLKSLLSVKLKAGGQVTSNTLGLAAGEYYFSMESTNAKKGGSAHYRIGIGEFAAQPKSGNDMDALNMPESGGTIRDGMLSGPDNMESFGVTSAPAFADLPQEDDLLRRTSGLLA